MSPNLVLLAQWLAGEFDNYPQAYDQPAWFVSLRLWHRPLPIRINGDLAIFCEQANSVYLDAPYRQRVLILRLSAAWPAAQIEYRAFRQPERFKGAGANPSLLQDLTPDDLEALPGCQLNLTQQGERVQAEPPLNAKCCFQYSGETRQVILGFEASPTQFWSHDRGVDPNGNLLWGAIMGAYEFQKRQDFAAELPLRAS
ncbi:MAG: chromophore lyase CpcT/CpeT [Pegethrix bostrychoides GSE-TBD4-15B]|jgi:hypothetical protein|uniref:Chromophore lyase CpcT/CpeT n=1 Tax=Pegethrix bostrychoides GSE-TBD4-15B TaxID=2839662 RepID=A0A951U6R7_9CYAN|nr:chromophore lyase CpcT/CpeT [Pegethrix bostrychoides GSE-TBD4-15B]